jgi:hypothetical protein
MTGSGSPSSQERLEEKLQEADRLRQACQPPIEEFLDAADDLAEPLAAWFHDAGDLQSDLRRAALRVLAARRWLQHAQEGYLEQVVQEDSDAQP